MKQTSSAVRSTVTSRPVGPPPGVNPDGVVEQVEEDPAQPISIDAHSQVRRITGGAGAGIGASSRRRCAALRQTSSADFGCYGEFDGAGLQPRQVQHVADDPERRPPPAAIMRSDVAGAR